MLRECAIAIGQIDERIWCDVIVAKPFERRLEVSATAAARLEMLDLTGIIDLIDSVNSGIDPHDKHTLGAYLLKYARQLTHEAIHEALVCDDGARGIDSDDDSASAMTRATGRIDIPHDEPAVSTTPVIGARAYLACEERLHLVSPRHLGVEHLIEEHSETCGHLTLRLGSVGGSSYSSRPLLIATLVSRSVLVLA